MPMLLVREGQVVAGTASTPRCARISLNSGLANRVLLSIALIWTPGWTIISPATGVPFNRKENDYGTQKNARAPITSGCLANRQGHFRTTSYRIYSIRQPRGSGKIPGSPNGKDPAGSCLPRYFWCLHRLLKTRRTVWWYSIPLRDHW